MKIPKDIKILSLGFLFIFFGYASVQQYLTTYFSGLELIKVGFNSLILIYLFFTLSVLFSPLIISKLGAKKAMFISSLFYSAFIFILLTKSEFLIYLFSALLGIAASLLWTSQTSYLIRASNKKNYGRNSGFFVMFNTLGGALGVLILGFLTKLLSFEKSFLIFAFFPLISFLILFNLKNIKIKTKVNNFKNIKDTLKNKIILKISFIWFAFYFIYGILVGLIPLSINKLMGIQYVGILTSLFYILPIIFSYKFGSISDKIGRKKIMFFLYIISFFGLIILYFTYSKLFLIIGVLFIAINQAIIRPLIPAITGDLSNKKNLELINTAFWLPQEVGIVLSLFISKLIQTKLIYLIIISVLLISFILFISVFKSRIEKIKEAISKEIS